MSADHEATAKRLIPCDVFCTAKRHDKRCKHGLRPAIAAALAAAEAGGAGDAQAMINTLKRNCEIERETFEADQAEITRLKAEVERLTAALDEFDEQSKATFAENDRLRVQLAETEKMNVTILQNATAMREMLKAERDAAEVKTLERAANIANDIANRLTENGELGDSIAASVRDAIQAEIDKAGKKE